MAHRGLGPLERRDTDLNRALAVIGTVVFCAIIYVLYCLIVYSTVTP
jgi:hypothetical protein